MLAGLASIGDLGSEKSIVLSSRLYASIFALSQASREVLESPCLVRW